MHPCWYSDMCGGRMNSHPPSLRLFANHNEDVPIKKSGDRRSISVQRRGISNYSYNHHHRWKKTPPFLDLPSQTRAAFSTLTTSFAFIFSRRISPADISYIVVDTFEARASPAARIHIKVNAIPNLTRACAQGKTSFYLIFSELIYGCCANSQIVIGRAN